MAMPTRFPAAVLVLLVLAVACGSDGDAAGTAADAATAAAIDAALGFPDGPAAHEGWNAIDHAIASAAHDHEGLTVAIANRIWPRTGLRPDQAWVDLLATHHGVDVHPLDFAGDPSGSREVINAWVSERTEALIPELLPGGMLEPDTVTVLTNAIYLEARWERPFGKYGPVTTDFRRLDGTTVPVEMMRELELEAPRSVGDGYVAAEIPYVGGELSMLVVVADEGRFAEVRSRLGEGLTDEIDAALEPGPFELLLPRWTDETGQLDLLGWLQEVGAAPGHYPAIAPDVVLGAAVHGADIAVDEWGTVAAAATALEYRVSAPPPPHLEVAADRPFLYLIRHVDSGLVLFLGQVTDPT